MRSSCPVFLAVLFLLVVSSECRVQRIRGGSMRRTKQEDKETLSNLRRQLSTGSQTSSPTISPTSSPAISPTASPSASPTISNQPTRSVSAIEQALIDNNYALWAGAEFLAGEDSYRVKALRFLEETSDGMPDWRLGQRYALACIYYATNGVTTAVTDSYFWPGFTFDWLEKWHLDDTYTTVQRQDECSWPRVVCDSAGKVTELNLDNNYLTGTFPNESINLASTLTILNLEKNTCLWNKADTQTWFLGRFTKLTLLNLAETSFEYDSGLPKSIEHLTSLEYLIASEALFSGPIDETLFVGLTSLKTLDIQVNNFQGPLPTTLKDLPLKYVYLGASSLDGDLASFIGDGSQFAELEELWLDANEITGSIPTEFGLITTLESLSLTGNKLVGQIPSEMALLTDMEQIFLYNNQLTGTIPTEFASMSKLENFMVHENALTGSMPTGMCRAQGGGKFERLTADCHDEVTCYFGSSSSNCCTCCGDCTPTGQWT